MAGVQTLFLGIIRHVFGHRFVRVDGRCSDAALVAHPPALNSPALPLFARGGLCKVHVIVMHRDTHVIFVE